MVYGLKGKSDGKEWKKIDGRTLSAIAYDKEGFFFIVNNIIKFGRYHRRRKKRNEMGFRRVRMTSEAMRILGIYLGRRV